MKILLSLNLYGTKWERYLFHISSHIKLVKIWLSFQEKSLDAGFCRFTTLKLCKKTNYVINKLLLFYRILNYINNTWPTQLYLPIQFFILYSKTFRGWFLRNLCIAFVAYVWLRVSNYLVAKCHTNRCNGLVVTT